MKEHDFVQHFRIEKLLDLAMFVQFLDIHLLLISTSFKPSCRTLKYVELPVSELTRIKWH